MIVLWTLVVGQRDLCSHTLDREICARMRRRVPDRSRTLDERHPLLISAMPGTSRKQAQGCTHGPNIPGSASCAAPLPCAQTVRRSDSQTMRFLQWDPSTKQLVLVTLHRPDLYPTPWRSPSNHPSIRQASNEHDYGPGTAQASRNLIVVASRLTPAKAVAGHMKQMAVHTALTIPQRCHTNHTIHPSIHHPSLNASTHSPISVDLLSLEHESQRGNG